MASLLSMVRHPAYIQNHHCAKICISDPAHEEMHDWLHSFSFVASIASTTWQSIRYSTSACTNCLVRPPMSSVQSLKKTLRFTAAVAAMQTQRACATRT